MGRAARGLGPSHIFRRNQVRSTGANEVDDIDSEAIRDWEGVWRLDDGIVEGSDNQWEERAEADFDRLKRVMMQVEPRYTTPLTGQMWGIQRQVSAMAAHLKKGQKITVVMVTDGVPNDDDMFLEVMYNFQKLPAQFIVRLATDAEDAIQFWTTLHIELLDDFQAEAECVNTMNPWVNYCMPIQRSRTWGFNHPLFKILQERPLMHLEVRDYCALIFGVPDLCLPDPVTDWEDFVSDVEALMSREFRQWNPLRRSKRDWVDIKLLREIYGDRNVIQHQIKKRRLRKLRQMRRMKQEERRNACCRRKFGETN